MSTYQLTYLPAASTDTRRARKLREALAPYIDMDRLRTEVRTGADLRAAVADNAPDEVHALIALLADLVRPGQYEQITSPADVAALLTVQMARLDQEEMRVVCLDTKNHVRAIMTVYKGSVDSALIRTGELFREALRLNCPSIIIAHNHPSGVTTPSMEDIAPTQRVIAAGELLDITVLDHIIVGTGPYTSLRELGKGGFK